MFLLKFVCEGRVEYCAADYSTQALASKSIIKHMHVSRYTSPPLMSNCLSYSDNRTFGLNQWKIISRNIFQVVTRLNFFLSCAMKYIIRINIDIRLRFLFFLLLLLFLLIVFIICTFVML